MPSIAEIRQKFPQYDDMTDQQLADAVYRKFYSDMPRADFDAKLGGGSAAAEPQEPSTMMDMAKAGAAGFGRGVADLAGLPGSIGDVLKTGFNKGLDYILPGPNLEDTVLAKPSVVSGEAMRNYASAATGGATDYRGQTTAGKYAGTVGEFLPGAAAFGGGTLGGLLRYGAIPGIASEAAGQATEGTAAEPYARFGAAVLSPVAVGAAGRMVSARPGPTRAAATQMLKQEGVPLTAGQRTGSKRLQYSEQMLNPNKYDDFVTAQRQAFTKSALKKIGENADAASPEVMTRAYARIGGMFDDLAAKHSIKPDAKMVADLKATVDDYKSVVAQSNRAPFVENIAKDIVDEIKKNGSVSGAWYQNARSRLGKIIKAGGKEGDAAAEIQGALDAAMERSLLAKGSKDVGKWRAARNQYRDFLVIEKAAGGAAADTVLEGALTPQMLRNASKQVYGLRNYTQGKGPLTDLARAGAGVMEQLPNLGTAQRLSAIVPGSSAAVGATAGTMIGGPLGGVLGGMAGMMAPRMAGSFMLSRPGRALLGNQMFSDVDVLTNQALIRAGLVPAAAGLGDKQRYE